MRKIAKLILALDVDNFNKAKYFVNLVYPKVKIFKVGPQLFLSCGSKIIEFIHKKGAQVFLDLKFFDIPNTVAQACRKACDLGVEMLSLHIQGGPEMLKAAVKVTKKKTKTKRPLILGVTLLTSVNQRPKVKELSKIAKEAKLDGIICSAKEARPFRNNLGENFLIVTPGIRPSGFSSYDQKRTTTPGEAALSGADYLVVGRPILEAKDPLKVTEDILEEIYGAKRGNRENQRRRV